MNDRKKEERLMESLQGLNRDMYRPLKIINKGKTKEIWATNVPGIVILRATDDITAGDGAKHDTFESKARYANQTTCNVFDLLKTCNVPLAYIGQYDETSFAAEQCDMIPLEVVVRREAYGSYLKRNPEVGKGTIFFENPVVEFYLKTTERKWQGKTIPVDDPFIVFGRNKMLLYRPDQPIERQEPFLALEDYPLCGWPEAYDRIARIAIGVFIILEKVWGPHYRMVDYKVEFGINKHEEIVLADVIDNDSWRVLDEFGEHMDKQIYREGGDLASVADRYRKVAELTDKFPQLR
ncbi:MAG: phosphoribosylaminoimidazolesuccinocarboxamide synthase [Candidatus Izemoplasmatales bacterium]